MEKEELSVQDYFDRVKGMKNEMTDEKLKALTENSLSLLRKFMITGQATAAHKMYANLLSLKKETELVDLGISQFIYKDDLDEYMETVKDRVVKVTKLQNYTRIIPDDIIEKIEKTKGIFTDYFVVFTDYTGREERKVETEARNRDPILLGSFIYEKAGDIDFIERMYVIGDWVDEYCDLTVDKLIEEFQEVHEYNPIREIKLPETPEEALMMFEEKDGTEAEN